MIHSVEKELATHSDFLAWKISWMEESGRLQSTGSQRVRHDWAASLSLLWASLSIFPWGTPVITHWVQLTGTEVCSQQYRLSLTKATTDYLVCCSKHWVSGRTSYPSVISELPDCSLIALGLFHTGQGSILFLQDYRVWIWICLPCP